MITESQLEQQIRILEAGRRHHIRPGNPRGLVLRNGEVVWEPPADAAWGNVSHYRIYSGSESNLIREVPLGQNHIGDVGTADRIFVSAYNATSGLESVRMILNTKVSPAIAITPGSLLASKFSIGNFSNLADNPGFDLGDNGAWTPVSSSTPLNVAVLPDLPRATTTAWSITNEGQGRDGSWAGKHSPTAATELLENDARISCNPGMQLVVSGYAKSSSGATNGTMNLVIQFYDSTGAAIGGSGVAVGITGGVTSYQQSIFSATAPAGVVTARIFWQAVGNTVGTWYVDDVSCTPVIPSTALNIEQFGIGPNGCITLTGFTWTPNSPSAGKIAWSSGFVSYQGNLYNVSAGNSGTDFWIYWQLSNPTIFQTAPQGTPNIPALGPDDFIIALSNNGGATIDLAINLMRLADAGHRAILTSSSLFFINTAGRVVCNVGIGGAEQGRLGLWDSAQNAANTISLDPNAGPGGIFVGGVRITVP